MGTGQAPPSSSGLSPLTPLENELPRSADGKPGWKLPESPPQSNTTDMLRHESRVLQRNARLIIASSSNEARKSL